MAWFSLTNHNSLLGIATNEIAAFCMDNNIRQMAFLRVGQCGNKGDFCLIGWYVTLVLRLLLSARYWNLKNKDGVRRSDVIVDFASPLVREFLVNVAVFCFIPIFRMAGKYRARKLKLFTGCRFCFYWRVTVSLVASCSWLQVGKNVLQQVQNTHSNSAYVKFRERLVCRKCCCN